MSKVARITNDGKLLIKGELIEETHEPTNNIELDGVLRGWSGGYTTNPETPNIYYVKGLRGGFMFPQAIFEVGETYVLSFKIIKTSGDILTIGGHAQSFKDVEVYLDDELIGNNWNRGLQDTYPNDNLEHSYKVILTFDGSAVDSNLYVQINRENGYATEYTAEIYDLKLGKMNEKIDNKGIQLKANGDLHISGELTEVDKTPIYFEDNFDSGERSGEWQIERWGASPNNVVEEPFEDGWRFRHTTNGHANIAMFKQLPNITKGKLIIEFDWQPFNSEGASSRGAFFTIRGSEYRRSTIYGITPYMKTRILQLNAYSYENPRVHTQGGLLDYCNSSIYELGHYKIIIDVDKNTMSIYNNGVLINTYAKVNYVDDLYMEFSFGTIAVGRYSFVDNVTISIEEDINPLLSISDGLGLTITNLIENAIL